MENEEQSGFHISKLSNSVERNEARKLSILPTSLDIFDLRQHYQRILYILVVHGNLFPFVCPISLPRLLNPCMYEAQGCKIIPGDESGQHITLSQIRGQNTPTKRNKLYSVKRKLMHLQSNCVSLRGVSCVEMFCS